jgi:preprotein translocase subunit SecF
MSKLSFKSFLSNTKIGFMRIHKLAFSISIILSIISISFIFTRGLNFGIDFAGGILIEVRLQEPTKLSTVRQALKKPELGEISLQNFDSRNFMIKVSKNNGIDQNDIIKSIKSSLNSNFNNVEYRKVDFVGPQIGSKLIINGILALLLSFVFITIYIWIRFDWQFGFGAILALTHDTIIVLGLFAITGLEFNSTSIAALLTIIGYSINDSVVIYDRIRDNLRKFKHNSLSEILNLSINATLSRTILTAGTTLVALLSLIIFGGEILKSFSIATFAGILIGTYSSIYISAPILLYMDPRKESKRHHKTNKKS